MASFPLLSTNARTCLPWTRVRSFRTDISQNPIGGQQYSWAWRGAGLSGLPSNPLYRWELSLSPITAAELTTFENFWVARKGRYDTFDFTDPEDLSSHTKCRFDMDSLDVRYPGPGQYELNVTIVEFN